MNIAIISEHASPICALGGADAGGQNVYVAQLARHLAKRGHKVDVFTRRDGGELPLLVNWGEGLRLINVPAGPPVAIEKESLLPFMEEFTNFTLNFIKKEGRPYDVIHSNFFMSGMVAAEIKKELGIPFAITFHALGKVRRAHQGKKDRFPDERFSIEESLVQQADAIIAECPQDNDDLIRLYEAPINRLHMIPCGYDQDEMKMVDRFEARSELGMNAEEKIVLHLGRMVPRKGVDTVIQGFAKFVRSFKGPARLFIVGGDSEVPEHCHCPEIKRLMKLVQSEGMSDRIVFTGSKPREVLKKYYSAADVFVTTPWYEPFGITPLEAMACGTPVI